MKRLAIWILALPFAAGCAISDDLPPANPRPDEGAPPAPVPRPSGPPPELAQLDFLLGTWDAAERYPDGGSGKGTMIVQKRIGNSGLVIVYRSQGPMGVFDGHGVIRYDSGESVFRFWWFDTMAPGHAFVTSGRLQGNTLTLTGSVPPNSRGRVVYRNVEEGKVEFSVAMDEGGGWKTMLEATYTRK
jgi:hypothetical protein